MSKISSSGPKQTYTQLKGEITDTNGRKRGDKGAQVSDMQKMLKAAGFDPGPLDGKFGPRTEAALKAYQNATGAQVDGSLELGELTRLKGNYEKIVGSDEFGKTNNNPAQLNGGRPEDVAANSTGEQMNWLRNFANKLPHYTTALDLVPAEVALILQDALWTAYIVGEWQPASRIFAKAATQHARE